MTYFIQRRSGKDLETVDEFPTKKEAQDMRHEHAVSDPSAYYYVSNRCCKAWKEKK